jgi:hypothetical protein
MNDVNQVASLGFSINDQTGRRLDAVGDRPTRLRRRTLFDQTDQQDRERRHGRNRSIPSAVQADVGRVHERSLAGAKDPIDNFNDGLGRTIDPIDRVGDHMNMLAGAIESAVARINAAGKSSFTERTLAQRAVA